MTLVVVFTLDLRPAKVKPSHPIVLRSQPQVIRNRSLTMVHRQKNQAGESSLLASKLGQICQYADCSLICGYCLTCLGGHWGPPPPARKTATPTGLVQEDRQPLPPHRRRPSASTPHRRKDRQPLPRIVEKTVSLYHAS